MAKEIPEERNLNVNANIFEFFITALFVHYGSWIVGRELEDSAQVLFIPGYLGYKDFMLQYGLTSRSSIVSWRLELSWHFSSDSDIPKNDFWQMCIGCRSETQEQPGSVPLILAFSQAAKPYLQR